MCVYVCMHVKKINEPARNEKEKQIKCGFYFATPDT